MIYSIDPLSSDGRPKTFCVPRRFAVPWRHRPRGETRQSGSLNLVADPETEGRFSQVESFRRTGRALRIRTVRLNASGPKTKTRDGDERTYKRPHIKAAARDANVVTTVYERRRFCSLAGCQQLVEVGAREPHAVRPTGMDLE